MADATIRVSATDDASRVLANVRSRLQETQGAASALGPVLGRLGVAFSVGAAVAWVRNIVNGIDAMNDLKDATGASIENISALEDVALRTGTSFDTVGTSLVKFNAALSNSKPGSDAAAAFDAIGLSVKDLKTLDPAEALRQTAVALSAFADDGNKARLVQELFGKSLREVAPLLNDLAKQSKLVATVTTEEAEAAEKFNHELSALTKNLTDVGRSLAGRLLIGMNALIDKFREGTKAGEGFIVTLLRQTEIARLLGLAAAKRPNTGGASGTFESAESEQARKRLERQGKLSVDFDGAIKPEKTKKVKKQADEITDAQRALAQYVEGLQRELEKNDELTASEKALNFLKSQGTAGQVPQVRELVLSLAEQVDKEKELAQALEFKRDAAVAAGNAVAEANREFQAQQKALDDELNNLSGRAGDDRKRALTARLAEQLDAGGSFSPEELDRIVRGIGGVNEKIAEGKTLAEELGLSFTSAFEDAIVGGRNFSEVLKGLEQDILRIVTRKIVTEPLGNAISGAIKGSDFLGGIGKLFSGLFSADGGGFTGSGPRSGGLDGKGGFIGMLHPNETVLDHSMGQGGNVVSITVNQSFAAGTNRATTLQAAADASRQLQLAGRNL